MANKYWIGTSTPGDYSVAANWSPSGVPIAGDVVYIQGAQAITAGLSQGAIVLTQFIVQPEYTGKIGTLETPLEIDTSAKFDFAGQGISFIDIKTGNPTLAIVRQTYDAGSEFGLTLVGIDTVTNFVVNKGRVQFLGGAVTNLYQHYDSNVDRDSYVHVTKEGSFTNLYKTGGYCLWEANGTLLENSAGRLVTGDVAVVATIKTRGGTCEPRATGTITDLHCDGGLTDMTTSRRARTVTDLHMNGGRLRYDPNVVTMTAPADGNVEIEIGPNPAAA